MFGTFIKYITHKNEEICNCLRQNNGSLYLTLGDSFFNNLNITNRSSEIYKTFYRFVF